MENVLLEGACEEMLKTLDSDSIDSIVTDPPYELGFMNKSWDSSGIAYNVNMWKECFRVLKPGGHLLSFGGSRTYHRMACAIEDAGFELRDMIEWVYGSGFPKSLNVGKAVDKLQGNEREDLGISKNGSGAQPNKLNNHSKGDTGIGYMDGSGKEFKLTKGTSEWEGWGTALKPAHEPICLARKPLSEKTVAENVLKHGCGGLNIDECRVETDKNDVNHRELKNKNVHTTTFANYGEARQDKIRTEGSQVPSQGRWPANFIHDGSDEVLERFPNTKSGNGNAKKGEQSDNIPFRRGSLTPRTDHGSAARFFYCAKTSKSERGEGNNHPTVKPIKLIEYLCKLITPPNGIILDPFGGSGTTALAAMNLGFNYVLIEKEPEYCEIIKNRIKENEKKQSSLDVFFINKIKQL